MDLKEMEKRRGWPWKKKNGFGEGGTSPPTVKLFDEQEVARILEDQIRGQQEQMDSTLREVDEKYSEREKAVNEKLDAVNKKLTTALAEITVKDNLVKQHIKVAEEAVVGWERAENESAAFKAQLDEAVEQKRGVEDRAQHLDGALKEVVKQLRSSRDEHEQRILDIIVKKTQEYDKLRVEMEAKLAEASHMAAQTRAELIECRAENQALTHALQDRSRVLAELNDTRARQQTNMKVLQVRLEGMEKENIDLKYDIHLVTKELDARMSEVDHVRRASDLAARQQGEALKKVAKLEEECTRLRALLRKKLPNSATIARLKQDVDGSGRELTGKVSPRRRPLGRGYGAGDQQDAAVQENLLLYLEERSGAEKIFNLEEETRMLKEALAKRNDELQNARIMCAKTASRLSSVEEEVEALRLASKSSQVEKELFDASSLRIVSSKRDNSLNFELMDDFIEMERLAESESHSHSVSGSEHTTVETALVFGAAEDSNHQLRIAGLEEALAVKDRDLEAANKMCCDLSNKLAVAEEQFVALQSRNTANEQSVIDLQDRLDSLLESQAVGTETSVDEEVVMVVRKLVHIAEALAQATGTESSRSTTTAVGGSESIALSLHWEDSTLDASMGSLVQAANAFLESGYPGVLKFVSELTATLDCILVIHITVNEEVRKERETSAGKLLGVVMDLESARVQVSELEEELCRVRADVERKVQVETDRFPELEGELESLRAEKNELETNISEMDQHLVEANDRVEALRVRLSESEALVTELKSRETAHEKEEKEEDLLEQELLELSFPSRGLGSSMRAADEEMHHLHDKVAALEVELQGERRRHQEVVAKLEDMQEQIHRGIGSVDPLSRSFNDRESAEHLQLALIEDDATKLARKEKEIAAAALAECQRTILALGKQLKVLGLQNHDLTLADPASPDSIEEMTHTMEFLRSQADMAGEQQPGSPAVPGTSLTWAPRPSPRPGTVHHKASNVNGSGSFRNGLNSSTDGPVLSNSEQSDCSAPDLPSSPVSPASPVRVLRSVRTIRGSRAMKASNGDSTKVSNVVTNVEETSVESRSTTTSTFRRFYSRSQSETSMSSEHSNPGPV